MSLLKLLAAAALLSIPSSAAAKPENYAVNEKAIVQVHCPDGLGTAFKVTQDKYVTAKHVVVTPGCKVNGVEITDVDLTDGGDYATFKGPHTPDFMSVNCGGFKSEKTYVAIGHGLGFPIKMHMPWIATDFQSEEYVTFVGEGLPGMSGGPVVNKKGEVVGTVNMRWPTRSRALRDTPLCE